MPLGFIKRRFSGLQETVRKSRIEKTNRHVETAVKTNNLNKIKYLLVHPKREVSEPAFKALETILGKMDGEKILNI